MTEQIELFPKRSFVCDCPTHVGSIDCTLHKGIVAGNEGNKYGQNFDGTFCRCRRPYDAKLERETMVQCLMCEDWYHESCLNLRTRPAQRLSSPDPAIAESDDTVDVDSNISNDLPPPLMSSSTYDTLICGACVLANETLRRWAGTKGVMMVVRSQHEKEVTQVEEGGIDPRWKVLNGEDEKVGAEVDVTPEGKRLLVGGEVCVEAERARKRLRVEGGSRVIVSTGSPQVALRVASPEAEAHCLAPPPISLSQRVLKRLYARTSKPDTETKMDELGEGDIFLTEGWRERWCRCPKVYSLSYFGCHLTFRSVSRHFRHTRTSSKKKRRTNPRRIPILVRSFVHGRCLCVVDVDALQACPSRTSVCERC